MFSVTSNAPNLERLISEMGLDKGFRLFWIQMPTLWNIYKVTILPVLCGDPAPRGTLIFLERWQNKAMSKPPDLLTNNGRQTSASNII